MHLIRSIAVTSQKRPTFLHADANYFELPSDISSVGKPIQKNFCTYYLMTILSTGAIVPLSLAPLLFIGGAQHIVNMIKGGRKKSSVLEWPGH